MKSAERRFALFILAAFLAVDATILATAVATWSDMVPDFFGFWSTARYAATHDAAMVYDPVAVAVYQHSLLERFTETFVPAYSPAFLLTMQPFTVLPYTASHLLWVGGTFLPFLAASIALLRQPGWVVALMLTPVVTLNVIYGQTGFLTSAAMIGALLLMPTRPWAAGFCLAILAFKPQLGLLMPIVLLARRDFRTIATTFVWLLAFGLLSSLVLGWTIWWHWVDAMLHLGQVAETARDQLAFIMASVTSGAFLMGAPTSVAHAAQLAAIFGVGTTIWIVWQRRAGNPDLAIALTMVGSFLVTPYAFNYDLPVAMCAALLFVQTCQRQGATLSAMELLAVIFVLVAPLIIFMAPPRFAAVPLSLLALFAIMARRALAAERPAAVLS